MLCKFDSYILGCGKLEFLCLFGMLDYYINVLEKLFFYLGRLMFIKRQ